MNQKIIDYLKENPNTSPIVMMRKFGITFECALLYSIQPDNVKDNVPLAVPEPVLRSHKEKPS